MRKRAVGFLATLFVMGVFIHVAEAPQAAFPPAVLAIQSSGKITITSAELDALNTSPVVLVPAAGANKIIVPIEIGLYNKPGSTAYAYTGGNGYFGISYPLGIVNLSGYSIPAVLLSLTGAPGTGGLSGNADAFNSKTGGNYPPFYELNTSGADEPLTLQTDGGVFSGGNGTLELTVLYYVANIS
jgi:hypothetical protein